MTFGELLRQNRDAIGARWLEAALAVYPEESTAAFRREKDPFANPVGHSLRTGTRELLSALLDGMDDAGIRQHLQEIISIRAVQEFSPSQTLGFVFELKQAVRDGLGAAAEDPRHIADLVTLDGRIDQLALAAFDVFAQCRERVSELRVNEIKKQVSWIVGKLNQQDPELAQTDAGEGN